MKARIYHNPRCSKSRAALALLEQRGVELEVVEYLRDPPSRSTLERLFTKLGEHADDIVRKDEPEYRSAAAGRELDRDALLELIAAEPKLLQRPIVEVGDRAVIGRPPERVLELVS